MTADEKRNKWLVNQNRGPPDYVTWRSWFATDGSYLGLSSARTGPDAVETRQKCTCDVCAVTSKQDSEDGQP